jgi:membrane-bound inhibitor of C-type lysozyme
MLPNTLKTATLALVLFSGQLQAKAEDPFISTAETRKISVQYASDARALHVTIKNEGSLMLTAGTLVCDKYDRTLAQPKVASTGFPWCKGDEAGVYISGRYKKCEYDSPYLAFFEETVKPGKTKTLYFELEDYQVPVQRCEVKELRGRAAKLWDF